MPPQSGCTGCSLNVESRLDTDRAAAVDPRRAPGAKLRIGLVGCGRLAEVVPEPWVGFNRRFDQIVERVAAAVPRDEPVQLDLRLHYRRASWAPHVVSDDTLLDLGPHLVDLATWLTGSRPLRVRVEQL